MEKHNNEKGYKRSCCDDEAEEAAYINTLLLETDAGKQPQISQ
jgi:hypothetical protein